MTRHRIIHNKMQAVKVRLYQCLKSSTTSWRQLDWAASTSAITWSNLLFTSDSSQLSSSWASKDFCLDSSSSSSSKWAQAAEELDKFWVVSLEVIQIKAKVHAQGLIEAQGIVLVGCKYCSTVMIRDKFAIFFKSVMQITFKHWFRIVCVFFLF